MPRRRRKEPEPQPKRIIWQPGEAQAYLEAQQRAGRIHHIPATEKQQKRLASGLKRGKSERAAMGHPESESHQTRAAQAVSSRARRHALTFIKATEWRVGPGPHPDSDPTRNYGRIPQPADLIRLVEKHSHAPVVSFGIYGYVRHYLDPTSKDVGWLYPHFYIDRQDLLELLYALPQDHYYTQSDPAYLQLAHDVSGVEEPQVWQWGYVFQFSVRDVFRGIDL